MYCLFPQLLPHCVLTEWKRCANFLEALIKERVLNVPYRILTQRSVPLVHLTTLLAPLSVSLLLSDVITLMQYSSVHKSPVALAHITKCYIATLKVTLFT